MERPAMGRSFFLYIGGKIPRSTTTINAYITQISEKGGALLDDYGTPYLPF